MKTNLLKKGKWYIVGFILVVIMLSVGLSFCTWDDYSLKAVSADGKTGSYGWSTIIKKEDGTPLTTSPTLGQVVQYGRFWQDKDAEGEAGLKPQRWIVVDIDANNVATLLTEKVVVYGNFWGNGTYYQNYYQSTLRAWLNSGRDSVTGSGTNWTVGNIGAENKRDDGIGSAFSGTDDKQANRGFLDVAFDTAEKSILVPKNISGIKGLGKQNSPSTVHAYTTRNNNSSINDLVWVPSWSEIYGTTTTQWGETTDGSPYKQFKYFENNIVAYGSSNTSLQSGATDYAYESYDTIASYYDNGVGGRNGNKNITNDDGTWWWLRSPRPSLYHGSLMVYTDGSGAGATTSHSYGGVRPAVCVQL